MCMLGYVGHTIVRSRGVSTASYISLIIQYLVYMPKRRRLNFLEIYAFFYLGNHHIITSPIIHTQPQKNSTKRAAKSWLPISQNLVTYVSKLGYLGNQKLGFPRVRP